LISFRSNGARLAAWTFTVFAVLNLADIAYRGRDRSSAVAAAVLLLGCGCAYVLGLRPKVVGDDAGVWVVNPLRTYTLPWSSVQKIGTGRVLTLTYDGVSVQAWAVQTSQRPKGRPKRKQSAAPIPDKIAEAVKTRTPVDFAVEQLAGLQARSTAVGKPSVAWSPLAIGSLVVPLLAVIVLAVF
jgi:hypothetical protein